MQETARSMAALKMTAVFMAEIVWSGITPAVTFPLQSHRARFQTIKQADGKATFSTICLGDC
jgi:hypothetical protein